MRRHAYKYIYFLAEYQHSSKIIGRMTELEYFSVIVDFFYHGKKNLGKIFYAKILKVGRQGISQSSEFYSTLTSL